MLDSVNLFEEKELIGPEQNCFTDCHGFLEEKQHLFILTCENNNNKNDPLTRLNIVCFAQKFLMLV